MEQLDRGIDLPINKQVARFQSKLWTESNCEFYGRIFVNERNGEKIPQRFGSVIDYRDVLINDLKDCTCFFEVDPENEYDGYVTAKVNIYFSVNLVKLYSFDSRNEATEMAHSDAINRIENDGIFKITGLVRGIESFKAFKIVKETDDYHPRYLFAIKTKVKYLKC